MSDWLDAERHAERAQKHSRAGRWDRALEELRKALHVIPDQSDWLLGMAVALDALERYEEAAAAYERVLKLRGDNVETLVALGIDLVRSGDPSRAITVFERANEIDPKCEAGYCHRIAAYAQIEDHESAELMFYMARQVLDECPICYDYLAQSLALRGELQRAIWCWEQTARLAPELSGIAGSLARAYWQMDQLELARHYFEAELRENPKDTDALLALGVLLLELEKPAEAGEKFRRALEVDGTLFEAHLYLGELSFLSGHIEAAEARFERAHQIDPSQPGAHAGLAQVALHRKDHAAARQHLSAELDTGGQTTAQSINLARMLIESDMAAEAVTVLDPLVREATRRNSTIAPLLPDMLLCRGAALMMLGDVGAGIADTRRAVRLDPDNAVGMHNLSLAYLEVGSLTRARFWIERALREDPAEPNLTRTRSRIRRAHAVARARRLSDLLLGWLVPAPLLRGWR